LALGYNTPHLADAWGVTVKFASQRVPNRPTPGAEPGWAAYAPPERRKRAQAPLASAISPASVEAVAAGIIPPVPLNHVALTVSDRERSAAFYAEHFGLTERIHHDEHLLILASADGSVLALNEGSPADLPPTNHFGFQVAGATVRAARERFRAAGVEETEWQDDGRFVRVQVADPDGYRVELYAF
jgi:catechol 2,3-dioxygenase-like lactoylglutathione lyase family enzyme